MNKIINEKVSQLAKTFKDKNDKEIIKGVITKVYNGDAIVYLLYGRYIGMLKNLFFKFLINEDYLQDILQYLIIELIKDDFKMLKNFNWKSDFSTWLYVVSRNTFVNECGKIKKAHEGIVCLDEADSCTSVERSNYKRLLDEINNTISYMKSPDERLVLLKMVNGCDTKELAKALAERRMNESNGFQTPPDVSINNVYKIKQRAKGNFLVEYKKLYGISINENYPEAFGGYGNDGFCGEPEPGEIYVPLFIIQIIEMFK